MLDQAFARARETAGQMPVGLEQCILADADGIQAGFGTPEPPRRAGLWSQLLAALGGWPTLGGLATACAAGVWIGVAPPNFLPDPVQLVLGAERYLDFADMDDLAMAMSEEEG